MSNLLGWDDDRADHDASVTIRPARPAEYVNAIQLLFGGHSPDLSEAQVREFIASTQERGGDLGMLHVGERGGTLTLACMPLTSPGRTMLMFTSPTPAKPLRQATSRLIDAVCLAAADRNVQLAQVLLEPGDDALHRIYADAGFESMAELIYLSGAPRRAASPPQLPPAFRWAHYSESTHDDFVRTIHESYRDGLDCPALNGIRDMRDVIEGHKGSGGEFEPKLWSLLLEANIPRGVLLLSTSGRGDEVMELIYLGLTPESRGRKLGGILFRQALSEAAGRGNDRLSLAVDAKNIPALKLYYRNGMARVATKSAMMRLLAKKNSRPSPVAPEPLDEFP